MRIPASYSLRNLQVRKITTTMTALGTTLSVAVLVSVLAVVDGLHSSMRITGDPSHLLILRNGSTSELVSLVTRQNFQDIISRPGIRNASLEMVTLVSLDQRNGSELNVNLRGIGAMGWEMRKDLRLVSGRLFRAGLREIVVGKALADKCPAARVGRTLDFGNGPWQIVGVMDGGRSAFNSEIFAGVDQVSADSRRSNLLSSVLVEAEPGQLDALARSLRDDRRLDILVQPEVQYYEKQMASATPVQFMGTLAALIMAAGCAFAGMNTMYAAVARRSSEIAVLRVLGFSRGSVLVSFLFESVVISALGGGIGCLLTLPLNNIETTLGSFISKDGERTARSYSETMLTRSRKTALTASCQPHSESG